ncbi:MAG: penicillin-binding protein 2 [Planctomycetota bacterium]
MRNTRLSHLKMGFLFPLFLTGVAVLAGRLYNVQITNHEYLVEQALRQSKTTVALAAMRGSIFDCNGEALALSLEAPSIFADPGVAAVPARIREWLPDTVGVPRAAFKKFLAANPEIIDRVNDPTLESAVEVTRSLAGHLGVPERALLERLETAINERLDDAARTAAPAAGIPEAELREALGRKKRFVWLRRRADAACARQVEELKIRGICVKQEQTRRTAEVLSIGQWLGFVGGEGEGLEGLELTFERRLRGTPGLARLRRDGRGRRIAHSADPTVPPRHGCNLYLTVDRRVQEIVDQELRRTFDEFSPLSVSAIVMDPATGRILAMGSSPGLDVAEMRGLGREELRIRLRNHPVQSVFEYGSTFKPFVAAAVIDLGIATPETKIDCERGLWVYKKRRLRDHHGYGIIPVADVIVYSSNIGAAKLGLMLGADRLRQYVSFYHFGRRHGVEVPAEEPGIVTSERQWTYFTTTSVPMGQEIAGTPLQLVAAFCSLINGGRLMQPYLVEAVEDPNTGEVTRRTPLELKRVISAATSATMRNILADVVRRGTGKVLRSCKYPIGGKTGTAQKSDAAGGYSQDRYVASFVGFAPVEQPKICVLVLADEPKTGGYYGGQVAAPAVGRIIDKTLALLDSAPRGPVQPGGAVAAVVAEAQ